MEYVFIDGAYLQHRYTKIVSDFFQAPVGPEIIDFRAIRASAQKAFYYDCLNDVRRDDESAADYEARIQRQEVFFDRIQAIDGFHVRLGSISGQRRRLRQKKVDVLLAIDMLTHAFYKNMDRATLIAGDLDFEPVVESLIRLGTYVRVMYEPTTAARDLYRAADLGVPLNFHTLYSWSSEEFRRTHPIPSCVGNSTFPSNVRVLRTGTFNGRVATLRHRFDDNSYVICVEPSPMEYSFQCSFETLETLERYFGFVYGEISWAGT